MSINEHPNCLLHGFLGRASGKYDDGYIPNHSMIFKKEGEGCGLRINDACGLGVRVFSYHNGASKYVR